MVKQRISLRDIDITINGKRVGGAEELAVTIDRDLFEAGEGGNYKTVEIVEGFQKVEGTLTVAYLDADLINTLFPNQAVLPEFTLAGVVNNSKTPDRSMKIFGVKFGGVDFSDMAKDSEYIKNALKFKAADWRLD